MSFTSLLAWGLGTSFSNPRLFLVQGLCLLMTLGAGYQFLLTPESTIPFLILSVVWLIVSLFCFSVAQAGVIESAQLAASSEPIPGLGGIFKRGIHHWLRVALIALLAVAVIYGIFAGCDSVRSRLWELKSYDFPAKQRAVKIISAIQFFLAFLLVPPIAIALWNRVCRVSKEQRRSSPFGALGRMLHWKPWLSYGIFFLIFAVSPYYLLGHHHRFGTLWKELAFVGIQLGIAALLIVVGWTGAMVTLANACVQGNRPTVNG